jgi:hypothetical protein
MVRSEGPAKRTKHIDVKTPLHQIVYLVWSTLIPNALLTVYILISVGHTILNTTLNRGKQKIVWATLIECVLYYCGPRYLQFVEIFNQRGPRYDRCPCSTTLEQERASATRKNRNRSQSASSHGARSLHNAEARAGKPVRFRVGEGRLSKYSE